MTTPVFTTEAREDLIAAVVYYDLQQPSLGARFETAAYDGALRIAAAPEAWPRIDTDARFFRLEPFPYALIYFADSADRAVIVAVFQLNQDPKKLAKRLAGS
ncbi:MAG: type II toxin-antitoxin system RelE/ParE family toxin [Pirellulales bacterium]